MASWRRALAVLLVLCSGAAHGGAGGVLTDGRRSGRSQSRATTGSSSAARRRQTINFSIPPLSGGYVAQLLAIKQAVNGSETSALGPAAHILFNLVGTPDATLVNQTRELLAAAVATRVPVFLGWDSQIFWGNRHDLWNHFNSSAPGFDPKNRENVEWTSWSPDDAVDVSWLNWGSQMRVAPAQNIHAPAVKAATAHSLGVVSKVIAEWWAGASETDRRMLAGIKIGCEAGIGWQAWQYKDGNAIFLAHPHNSSFDPTTGGNHSAPPDPPTFGHSAQIGFAAATSAGLKSESGPLTNADVQQLVHWYLGNMSAVVIGAGVPSSVLLTHYGGTIVPKGSEPVAPAMKYAGGEIPGLGLGVSLYDTLLDLVPSFVAGPAQREEGWGAVEFGLPAGRPPAGTAPNSLEAWTVGMNRTLSLKGCRMLSQVPLSANATAAANILIAAAAGGRS